MSHTNILFQSIGVLVDGQKMRRSYRDNMARLMSERYGTSPEVWKAADEQIVADWSYYHADLNFSGDDGIEDIHEALFRVTRALFRIAKVLEAPKSEITALGNELISIPCQNVLLPDVLSAIEKCQEQGYAIGTFSYLLENQVRAITAEIPGIAHVIGADTLNHYEHDSMYFRKLLAHLKTSPDKIVIVANSPQTLAMANQSGMQVIPVRQSSASLESELATILKST